MIRFRPLSRDHRDRHKQVHRTPRIQALKARRHHAHDHRWLLVDHDGPANDGRIKPKAPFPIPVSDNGSKRFPGFIIRGQDRPSNEGLRAQGGEVVAGNKLAEGVVAACAGRHSKLIVCKSHQVGKHGHICAERAISGIGERAADALTRPRVKRSVAAVGVHGVFSAANIGENAQLFGLAHRQALEQDGVEQAKHSRVCTNAQRQRQHRYPREARAAAHNAQAVAQVLSESFHPHPTPHLTAGFSVQSSVSTLAPRLQPCFLF